ncbi:molybdopterin-dependent oxidoreductase [Falsibacillus pallidus]|uniref:molybdopterin-dependent oxidoreductase n=1 Tax=Falsibacillus pallidus TaxID=493781 RepID=UPI003D98BCC1
MNVKLFFQRNLNFGKRLARLHHSNAILFFVLTLSGFILFSTSFRSLFPAVRVMVRDVHIWIGFVLCLPLLYYLPKMAKHLNTLRKRKQNRYNLYLVLSILLLLIVSGVFLTFHRQFPPQVSTAALFIHDFATWFGVPYVLYHSVTRSKWFKKLEKKQNVPSKQEPIEIDDRNPVYTRRSFLRMTSAAIIFLAFLPVISKWFKSFMPAASGGGSALQGGNDLKPLPSPNASSSPPVGGGRRGEFRYYTVTEIPKITNDNFRFTVDGLVKTKQSYNWEEFVKLHRDVQVSDFHCVTGWSVYDVTWEGIPLKKILEQSGIKEGAKYVKFYSADGVYTDTLTIKQAMMEDAMVAVLIDGKLIDQKNGGPVRLIVPKMYAYKSVKWLNRIEVISHSHTGYWEERGYSKDAWVKSI